MQGAALIEQCSGANGINGYGAGNSSENGTSGGSGTPDVNTLYGMRGAISILSNGGNGGTAAYYPGSRNHWGGNGGDGGTLTIYSAPGLVIDNTANQQTGGLSGLNLSSKGGNGGPNAINDDGHWQGQAGAGGSISLSLNNVQIRAATGAAISADASGGMGASSSVRDVDNNPDGAAGGRAGAITLQVSGQFTSLQGAGITALAAGGQGGGGTGNGDHPSGDGGSGGNVTITLGSGSALSSTDTGISARSIGGTGGGAIDGYQTPGGQGGSAGSVTVSVAQGATINTANAGADGIYALSQGGTGGQGGSSGAFNPRTGKPGGNGGDAGAVTVSNQGSITTYGQNARGVVAIAEGGAGGAGGSDAGIIYASGGRGGTGGAEQNVTVNNSGSITTLGAGGTGVLAQSLGGGGAIAGDATAGLVSVGGGGGNGGNGAAVTVGNSGTILALGSQTSAIEAQSIGGGGGAGGNAASLGIAVLSLSIGGHGGDGGNGGTVSVTNSGSLTATGYAASDASTADTDTPDTGTQGGVAAGILAQSIGGGGGSGGGAWSLGTVLPDFRISLGGSGGAGGDGAAVAAINGWGGEIATTGSAASGIMALSIGGGGGSSGSTFGVGVGPFSLALGGSGGAGGAAGSVTVLNAGRISTIGAASAAIDALSLGGGGGVANSTFDANLGPITLAIGGSGGNGGAGSDATATNMGMISTAGAASPGMRVLSIGGGGGNATTVQSVAASGGLNTSLTLAGQGGSGGSGGTVSAINQDDASIVTAGDSSIGLLASSIGGGGGSGSAVANLSLTAGLPNPSPVSALALSVAIGGKGGSGGSGGAVSASNAGSISTSGALSTALAASSIGGGGGTGGSSTLGSITISPKVSATVGVSIGGSGGSGGAGGMVHALNTGTLTTTGAWSDGLFALSLGGGGGTGGSSIADVGGNGVAPDAFALSSSAAVGGSGGSGNTGGAVIVDNAGRITTTGNDSNGILALSIGGGGGAGGTSQSLSSSPSKASANVRVGGAGGAGNDSGAVSVTNIGAITTSGANSSGISAQSIGGGGGNGGSTSRLTASAQQSLFGDVSAINSLVLTLQKISADKWTPANFSISGSAGVSVGGSGGSGGSGNTVTVVNNGAIQTSGDNSAGIFAQSIGGGGGNGGAADATSAATLLSTIASALGSTASWLANLTQFSESLSANVSVGGSGGSAGDGGTAAVSSSCAILTHGDQSPGILAQSIGGGGGSGGSTGTSLDAALASAGASSSVLTAIFNLLKVIPFTGGVDQQISVGGAGGVGGSGGQVTVSNSGSITTTGHGSAGILAQSIGGGGGVGASSQYAAGSSTLNLGLQIGGSGGSGNDGGAVVVSNTGQMLTGGASSSAIIAQSVGGGGGSSSAKFGVGGGVIWSALGGSTAISVGASGASGKGGAVSVGTGAGSETRTTGLLSPAILAQSIGAGGGTAAFILSPTEYYTGSTLTSSAATSLALGATAKSSQGDGGTVTAALDGQVSTAGALSIGLLAQSIGGGGGLAVAATPAAPTGAASLSLGAQDGAGGNGGTVTITQAGSLTTTGQNSFGILAQSIGAGGGLAGQQLSAGLNTLENTSRAGSGAGSGAGGDITITLNGTLETQGAGAAGVVAQSIGGGGGLAGDTANGSYGLDDTRHIAIAGGEGDGGAIGITLNGRLSTTGNNAPGIVAMSIGGGGIFNDGNILVKDADARSTGGAVSIGLGSGAALQASGANSPALYAASIGNGGGAGGDVAITLARGASVLGGSGSTGSAITALSLSYLGSTATPSGTVAITNAGTISAASGTAIRTSAARTTLSNSGTIQGDLLFGAPEGNAQNTLLNNAGGALLSGGTLALSGVLTNDGTISPGGAGVFTTTQLTGALVQRSGTLAMDVDFLNRRADQIAITSTASSGASSLGGTITPLVINPLRDTSLTLLTADQPLAGFSATAVNSTLFSYPLTEAADGKSVSISANANFRPAGIALSGDRMQVANYLQTLWNSGYSGAAPLFNAFTGIQGGGAYRQALDTLATDVASSWTTRTTQQSFAFMNRLMSCPEFIDAGTRTSESSCTWLRVIYDSIGRGSTAADSGYHTNQVTVQLGAQREVQPDWFVGASISYNSASTTSSDNATTLGSDGFDVGATVKHQVGHWLFAGALKGGYDTSRMHRQIMLPDYNAVARSTPQAILMGGRLRAAYQIPFASWYLRPTLDLDMNYAYQPSYRESGGGLLNLAVASGSQTSFMATPSVEVGGRVNVAGMTLRPYASGGVSFLQNGNWTSRISFADMPMQTGSFAVSTQVPSTYATVTAGAELLTKGGLEMRLEYGLRAATDYTDQSATLRLAWHF